jgi:hypothetical protein
MKFNSPTMLILSLLTSVTMTTQVFADSNKTKNSECKPINRIIEEKKPAGVCVFDIDDTLGTSKKNTEGHGIKYPNGGGSAIFDFASPDNKNSAQEAINACLNRGFAIAIATAAWEYRPINEEFDFGEYGKSKKLDFGNDYDIGTCNSEVGNDTNVRKTNPTVNPIYITQTLGPKFWTPEDFPKIRPINKSYAMERIMRSYYGFGAGGRFADKTNPWLAAYQQKHGEGSLPDKAGKKNVSGCVVLFDDDQLNLNEVAQFNAQHDFNFQGVKVDPATGVTSDDVNKVLDSMQDPQNPTCKLEQ